MWISTLDLAWHFEKSIFLKPQSGQGVCGDCQVNWIAAAGSCVVSAERTGLQLLISVWCLLLD